MARYTYNANLVLQTQDDLSNAIKALDNTNGDIQKGINTIINARGAENIDLESVFSGIKDTRETVIESINGLSNELKKKAEEIENYQSAPWYKKVFATLGMAALKLVEGLATFVENIGDGIVSIVGFIGGLFSSDFQDCIAEFVKKDWVGDFSADQYENGGLTWINTYSAMSHESTAANVLKGIGVVSGYIIIGVATGGSGLAVTLGVSAGVALAAGIGSGTQTGLQQGKTFNSAFGQGVKEGAIAAGTTLVLGAALSKLGNVYKGLHVADDLLNVTDDALNAADDALNVADDFINNLDDASRSLITEGGDDTINVLGRVADKSGNGGYLVQNSNGVKSVVGIAKDGGTTVLKLTGESADEFINAVTKAGGTFDDFASATSKTSTALSQPSAASTIGNSVDDVVNATASTAKTSPKVVQAVKDLGTKFANSNVGQAIGKAVANDPSLITSGTMVGAVQQIENANSSMNLRTAELVSMGVPTENAIDALTTLASGEQGTNITDSTTPVVNNQSSQPNNSPGYSANNGSYTNTQIKVPETNIPNIETGAPESSQTQIQIPQSNSSINSSNSEIINDSTNTIQPSGNNNASTPSISTPPTTNNSTSVVDKIKDAFGYENNNTTDTNAVNKSPLVNGIDRITSVLTGNNANNGGAAATSIVGKDVLESITKPTGTIESGITGNKTIIPKSSSPILTTNNPTSSSVVPLGAGVGAASLAGVGAKAFLDKKQSKKEKDKIENLEDWEEEPEKLEIDYENKNLENEEADYLTPTDEYAYQN